MDSSTSVLIVGGSLNGLTTAMLLARRGVPCVVVERHPRTSIQYKFRGISPRSMEIYRGAGIEAEIRARDLIDERSASVGRMKNLADSDVSWQGIPWSDTTDISPTTAATCDQDQLEPILRAQAERHGADVRFNTELVSFTQTPGEVLARIRDRSTRSETTVRAQHLVAADGTQSAVREAVGIRRHGAGVLQHWMNVIFEADLPTVIDGRPIRSVFVTDINGTLVPRGDGRWLMAVQFVPDSDERAEDFTPDHCRELIRRAAGRLDLRVNIVDARPWEAAAAVADRYREGRVFLVGDSAHVMPPTGGFGGNTGIQDAYNLAWKLEAVVKEVAGPELLDTYDSERRPIADRTVAQALARLQAWFKDPSRRLPPPEPIRDDNAVIFGYRYLSGAFVDDDGHGGDDLFEDPRRPSGRPGSRAPHFLVTHHGAPVSTIDLFSDRWVLASGPGGIDWSHWVYGSPAARTLGVGWHGVEAAGDVEDAARRFSTAYGVEIDGAVLIRPTGSSRGAMRQPLAARERWRMPSRGCGYEPRSIQEDTSNESETRTVHWPGVTGPVGAIVVVIRDPVVTWRRRDAGVTSRLKIPCRERLQRVGRRLRRRAATANSCTSGSFRPAPFNGYRGEERGRPALKTTSRHALLPS